MSYANGTTHYNLPQTVGTDKRDWFDSNAAFAAVDAALYAAATGQASDAEAITALQQTVAGQATDIAALQTASSSHAASISALQTAVNGQATQIADVRQDAEDMITANNEGAAATSTRAYSVGDYFIYNDVMYKATASIAIGDAIVPNTNCEATNVDTELTQLNSDLDGAKEHLFNIGSFASTTLNSGDTILGTIQIPTSTKRGIVTVQFTLAKVDSFVRCIAYKDGGITRSATVETKTTDPLGAQVELVLPVSGGQIITIAAWSSSASACDVNWSYDLH